MIINENGALNSLCCVFSENNKYKWVSVLVTIVCDSIVDAFSAKIGRFSNASITDCIDFA